MREIGTRAACPDCGSADVVSVTVQVVGQPLTARLCPACEWSEWQSEFQLAALSTVIGRARRDRLTGYRAVS